ncbi:hypothetical protein U1Q18_024987 [Sarracenia purpurea var. burkii]
MSIENQRRSKTDHKRSHGSSLLQPKKIDLQMLIRCCKCKSGFEDMGIDEPSSPIFVDRRSVSSDAVVREGEYTGHCAQRCARAGERDSDAAMAAGPDGVQALSGSLAVGSGEIDGAFCRL